MPTTTVISAARAPSQICQTSSTTQDPLNPLDSPQPKTSWNRWILFDPPGSLLDLQQPTCRHDCRGPPEISHWCIPVGPLPGRLGNEDLWYLESSCSLSASPPCCFPWVPLWIHGTLPYHWSHLGPPQHPVPHTPRWEITLRTASSAVNSDHVSGACAENNGGDWRSPVHNNRVRGGTAGGGAHSGVQKNRG